MLCSQRALGQVALGKKQHSAAAGHYGLAVGRNPLDAGSWFALGFCELKCSRHGHAAAAFTRCVQADLAHGEAWNNLGALHLAARRFAPAFKAMQVSLKHNRETWQVLSPPPSSTYHLVVHCSCCGTDASVHLGRQRLVQGADDTTTACVTPGAAPSC